MEGAQFHYSKNKPEVQWNLYSLCDDAYQYAKDAPPHHQPAQVPVHESPHESADLLLCQLFNTPAKVAVHLLTETRDTYALEGEVKYSFSI